MKIVSQSMCSPTRVTVLTVPVSDILTFILQLITCYVMLCYVVLCYVVLCYVVLCYVKSDHIILYQSSLCYDSIIFLYYSFPRHSFFSFLFVKIIFRQSYYDLTDSAIMDHRP